MLSEVTGNDLRYLEDVGLVRRVVGLGGAEVYDSRPEPHHHLVCRSCGGWPT
ncbi:MAG: transcriptional repressor [Gaiellales bacterium]